MFLHIYYHINHPVLKANKSHLKPQRIFEMLSENCEKSFSLQIIICYKEQALPQESKTTWYCPYFDEYNPASQFNSIFK